MLAATFVISSILGLCSPSFHRSNNSIIPIPLHHTASTPVSPPRFPQAFWEASLPPQATPPPSRHNFQSYNTTHARIHGLPTRLAVHQNPCPSIPVADCAAELS